MMERGLAAMAGERDRSVYGIIYGVIHIFDKRGNFEGEEAASLMKDECDAD